MPTVDRGTREAAIDDEGRLPCSLCECDCFEDGSHIFISWGHTVIQVACPSCANRFREIFRMSLAAARAMSRKQRADEERGKELEEETRG